MSGNQPSSDAGSPPQGIRPWKVMIIAFVVIVCVLCCGLMLIVPTRSISVSTVYKGF